MPFDDRYGRQVSLLMSVLPHVATQDCLALKGGTAINFFFRDMPRLSVDVDLTYVPVQSRSTSLAAIDVAMKNIAEAAQGMRSVKNVVTRPLNGTVVKLSVYDDDCHVMIEVTPVLRGCVFEPQRRKVTAPVERTFGFAETLVLSFADLYGGKIVAALDRQHPRDLFDVRELLTNEGIDDDLRRAFVVYLLGHNRPMHEITAPRRKDIGHDFERAFRGLTDRPIEPDELLVARERMIEAIVGDMPDDHRKFLVSFERGEADWSLLGLDHVSDLPAIKWRQLNLNKQDAAKRMKLVDDLKRSLGL